MRILFASAEAYPLAKTGGLADVSAALPRALTEGGVDVRLIVPGYPTALASAANPTVVADLPASDGSQTTRLIEARMPDSGLPVWLVDAPTLFNRPGSPYLDEKGRDWPDNAERFACFSRVAARLATGELVADWRADVVHANDWHTGLLPLLLGGGVGQRPASVFTIHNLACQGIFPANTLQRLGLPSWLFTSEGIEFYGNISFLKAGIVFSDHVTTVSPSYAREILTPEFGCGLDGLLRHRMKRLSGILNGVDYRIWDAATDGCLPAKFTIDDMRGKRVCKEELQRELQLEVGPSIPLIVWLSRITDQECADLVFHTLHRMLNRDVELVMLGEGDLFLEEQFQSEAQHYPGRLAVRIGYQERLAHRLLAGADLLLHPSRFEPCGLTPLYALRYGTLPIVRHVGGLTDTIVDATEWAVRAGSACGFSFRECRAGSLLDCLDRALTFFARRDRWRKMQQRAMSRTFGWDESARRYLAVYCKLVPDAPAVASTQGVVHVVPSGTTALAPLDGGADDDKRCATAGAGRRRTAIAPRYSNARSDGTWKIVGESTANTPIAPFRTETTKCTG